MSDWIEWVWSADKPYPETLETHVQVRTRDGWEDWGPTPVNYWHDENDSNWFQGRNSSAEIVAYRVVE